MSTLAAVIGRVLLAIIFLNSGAYKLLHLTETEQLIQAVGLPSGLALPIGVFELAAGLCLVFGVMTRIAAILLAGYSILTILFFHRDFADPGQLTLALSDLAIAGGLLLVFAHTQMWWSWDRMRAERRGEVAVRDSELRARDADLRAARAEGVAQATTTDDRVIAVDPDVVPDVAVARRRWF